MYLGELLENISVHWLDECEYPAGIWYKDFASRIDVTIKSKSCRTTTSPATTIKLREPSPGGIGFSMIAEKIVERDVIAYCEQPLKFEF